MSDKPKQLPLDLSLEPRFGREDFLVSPSNEAAYALIERWPDWPAPMLILLGPEGSGKSHLAAIWKEHSGAHVLDAATLTPAHAGNLTSQISLVFEDADRTLPDEAAFFHLLNAVREKQAFLLVTARDAPEHWGLKTPDLLSRLRLAPRVNLDPPDDALLKAVLVKLFMDRQLIVDTSVIDFIALRIERSLKAAAHLVQALDVEALSRGRRITRAMASELLQNGDNSLF